MRPVLTTCSYRPTGAVFAAVLVAAALVACGDPGGVASSTQTGVAPVDPSGAVVAPLFDLHRRPLPPAAALVPADAAWRTRDGLYASVQQYEREARTAGLHTVLLDLDALGSPKAALGLAEQMRRVRDTQGVAFYVRGRRPGEAARLADALGDRGFAPVFLVVTGSTPAR